MSRSLNKALSLLSIGLILAGIVLMVSIFLPRVWMPSPTLEEGAQRASQVSNTVEGSGASSGDSARPGGDSKGGEPNPVASREAVEPDAGRE